MSQHRLPLLSLPLVSLPLVSEPLVSVPSASQADASQLTRSELTTSELGVPHLSAPKVDAGRTDAGAGDAAATGTLPQLLQVGDLAKESGKTIRALHLYEELELLRPAARSKGGFRLYAQDALVRIRWISKLQDMGLSLGDIHLVVKGMETAETAPSAMNTLRQMYASKLEETRAQVAKLSALEGELKASLDYLAKCQDVCEPTRVVTDCGSCELHTESCQHAASESHGVPEASPSVAELPDLIRGIRTLPATKAGASNQRPSAKARA